MYHFLKLTLSILLLLTLSSCTGIIAAIYSIDASIPRETEAINQIVTIHFKYQDQEWISREIHFEKYYDAMKNTRGNFWAIREVGKESYREVVVIDIYDPKLGLITFKFPEPKALLNPKTMTLKDIKIHLGNRKYYYKYSVEGIHLYSHTTQNTVYGKRESSFPLKFKIKMDGIELKGVEKKDLKDWIR